MTQEELVPAVKPSHRRVAAKCTKGVRKECDTHTRCVSIAEEVWSQKPVALHDADCGGTDYYGYLRIFGECGHKNP